MNSGNTRHAEAILDSLKLKRLQKIKNKELLQSDEVKMLDLSDMSPLEGDEKKSKIRAKINLSDSNSI